LSQSKRHQKRGNRGEIIQILREGGRDWRFRSEEKHLLAEVLGEKGGYDGSLGAGERMRKGRSDLKNSRTTDLGPRGSDPTRKDNRSARMLHSPLRKRNKSKAGPRNFGR